jgi:hypothetical protein
MYGKIGGSDVMCNGFKNFATAHIIYYQQNLQKSRIWVKKNFPIWIQDDQSVHEDLAK